jgi:hypothetical protein
MRPIILALLCCLATPCRADIGPIPTFFAQDGELCRGAIAQAERRGALPPHLLAAIARVESGRRDPVTGAFGPWPWTINAEGEGFFFDSKAQAIAAVRGMLARGMKSIDIGCTQVNLMHHPDAFASLEAAFDPATNAAYAAKFLNQLQTQTGNWQKATAMYHSADPERGSLYQQKVAAALPEEQRAASNAGPGLTQGGNFLPPQRSNAGQILALPNAISGRNLDAYRSVPIAMISRIRRFGG